ncbi:dihydrofolate reductase [Neomicrococcus aestuarii]|uniref:Dihydrofolate reductase n=1 Tax=Neomicrococcus aestuarii TaxID=556325 RepID=A0A1L2ZPU0_9MICC|nr:dihydrofolate reductase [Neomicrococcus aestuarii]APF41463.1 dihydrofolate reductase [Neomicrococcus aestuarii]
MIWAQSTNGVIGDAGSMPWHLPEDLQHFQRVTSGHPIIMGRRTWESLPPRFRPLKDRTSIVLTSQEETSKEVTEKGGLVVSATADAMELARKQPGAEEIWVIGGGKLYEALLPLADTLVITRIDLELEGDTRAPELTDEWEQVMVDPAEDWKTSMSGLRYRSELWERKGA